MSPAAAPATREGISDDGLTLTLTVRVDQRHKEGGRPCNSLLCPWALGITDACLAAGVPVLAGAPVVVLFDRAHVTMSDHRRYLGVLPSNVRKWVFDFDHGNSRKLKPMVITWEAHLLKDQYGRGE